LGDLTDILVHLHDLLDTRLMMKLDEYISLLEALQKRTRSFLFLFLLLFSLMLESIVDSPIFEGSKEQIVQSCPWKKKGQVRNMARIELVDDRSPWICFLSQDGLEGRKT
jgi:hypothetical protein